MLKCCDPSRDSDAVDYTSSVQVTNWCTTRSKTFIPFVS